MHRRRRRVAADDAHVLAELPQREGHRQLRADGVAVGARVRDDDEALPAADLVGDRARGASRRGRRGHAGVGARRSSSQVALGARAAPLPRGGRGGSARCGPDARSIRRTGTRARARAAAAAAPPIWRRKNGVARSSAARRLLARLLVAERGVEDARQLQVGRHLHARQRDEADARVVDVAAAEQCRSTPRGSDRRRDRDDVLGPLGIQDSRLRMAKHRTVSGRLRVLPL